MKYLFSTLLALSVIGVSTLTGCATPRTKWTDPTMRILIDPTNISAAHYARIRQALHQNNRFIVVDRADGYKAVIEEQEREHRSQSDRFMDKEKYAIWGRVYGVGAVVVANAQCITRDGWFKHAYNHCRQSLAIVDARTSQVIAVGEAEADSGSYTYNEAPEWDEAVDKLVDNFPKNYEPNKDHQILRDYKDEAGEEAQRQKERLARETAGKKE